MHADEADAVRAALLEREPIFHREPVGADRSWFAALIAPDYWEVGASGRVYAKDFVLDTVAARAPEPEGAWAVDDFAVRLLGGGAWLATYLLHQGPRTTRRSTVWRREGDRWVALYHQGTPAPSSDA